MGERARSLGINGERKTSRFLRALGYEILESNNEKYNIDYLARFSSIELLRPYYSPEGLTAFEITTEKQLRTKKVDNFKAKIARYNVENPDKKISGGVLIIDQEISEHTIRRMESKGIFCWGIRRLSLYAKKIQIFNEWKERYYVPMVTELPLNKSVTCLRCATPPPPIDVWHPRSDKLLHFAIFFDDHTKKLHAKQVKEIMNELKKYLIPIVNSGVIPLRVHVEFHTLGGASVLKEDFSRIIKSWEDDGIIVCLPEEPIKDYRTFPTLPYF